MDAASGIGAQRREPAQLAAVISRRVIGQAIFDVPAALIISAGVRIRNGARHIGRIVLSILSFRGAA